jgi:hypothetical protein
MVSGREGRGKSFCTLERVIEEDCFVEISPLFVAKRSEALKSFLLL